MVSKSQDLTLGGVNCAACADKVYPLDVSFGPRMGIVRGVAIHITDGHTLLENHKVDWDRNRRSAHFVIDQAGYTAQYVALDQQAWAQGPANPNWISIEMTGKATLTGGDQMTDEQIKWGAVLLRELARKYSFPLVVAKPFVGASPKMGPGISKKFEDASRDIGFMLGGSMAKTRDEAAKSTGISCHLWLEEKLGNCPGLPMLEQLPRLADVAAGITTVWQR
jgi:N-acetyl-anhydromuramyl-L-alanine amidase AmpD